MSKFLPPAPDDDLGDNDGVLPPPGDDPISDTTPPTITNVVISTTSINLSSSQPSQTVTITAEVFDLESSLTNVHLNGLGASNIDFVLYTWNKTYYFDNFSSGTHTQTQTIYATNSQNLTSQSSVNLTINVAETVVADTTPPTISSFSVNNDSVSLNNSNLSQTVTFTATITDDTNVSIYNVSNASYSFKSGNNYYFTKTFSYDDYDFGDTIDVFTLTAADDAGNLATSSLNITINKQDTQAPTINAFSADDTTVSLTTSSQSQTVIFSANVGDNVALSSVSLPGTTLVSSSGGTYTFSKTYYYSSYNYGNSTDTRTLTVIDTNSNSTTDSITISITKTDTQSPVVSSFSANDTTVTLNTSNTTSQLVTFTATVTDNRAIDSVTVSGATFISSSGNDYTFTKLFQQSAYVYGNTVQTFTLTATDTTGNVSYASESITVSKTDTSGPTISSFSANNTNVSLTSTAEFSTVTFTVIVEDNVSVQSVTVSGATPIPSSGGGGGGGGDEIIIDDNNIIEDTIDLAPGDTTSGTSNTFQFSKTYAYDNYSYGSSTDNVICTVTDFNNNVSTTSLIINITKTDNLGPTISSFTVNDSSVSLNTSNSLTQLITFSATVSDNVAINTISLPNTTLVSSSGNNYSYQKLFDQANFSFGNTTQTFTLTATDTNGNSSTSSQVITISKSDSTGPTISSFSANDTSVDLNTSSSTSQTVTFTAVVSDNVSISSVAVSNATFSSSSGNNYTFTKTFSQSNFSYGTTTQTFTLTATDSNGNTATSTESITITKTDSTGPNISSFSASNTNVALTSNAELSSVTFTVVVADNVSVQSITVSGAIPVPGDGGGGGGGDGIIIDDNKILDDAIDLEPSDTTSGTSNTFQFIKTYSYNNYSYGTTTDNVICTVTDFNNNVSTADIDITITKTDTQLPTITSFSANTSSLTWYSSNADTSDKTLTLTAVVSDNVGINSISVTGATQTNVSGNTYTFTRNFSVPTLNTSSHYTLVLSVDDSAGNSSQNSLGIFTFYTDDTPPVISSFNVDNIGVTLNSTDSTSQTVTFTAQVSDNVSISSASLSGGVTLSQTIGVDPNYNYTWTKTFQATNFSFGNTVQTFTLTVTDAGGSTTTDSIDITITKADSSGPTISSFTANNTNVALTSDDQIEIVNFSVVVADNVGVLSISVSGATPILDDPNDDNDEIIIDENKIDDQVISLEAGDTSAGTSNTFNFQKIYSYANYTYGASTDTVVATVVDITGNTSFANLNINISKTDTQGPIITFGADENVVNLTSSGVTSAQTVTFTATVTDNVSVNSVSLPNTTFISQSGNTYTYQKLFDSDSYAFGNNPETFTLTTTDDNSNISTSSLFILIVKEDNTGPVISSFSIDQNPITVSSVLPNKYVIFTVIVADNVFVDTITVTGATPLQDDPDDDDDEIIIDDNKIDEMIIDLAPGDTTSGTFNIFRFSRIYSYADYVYGENEDNVTATVTDIAGNTSTSSLIVVINKVDDANPTIFSLLSDKNTITLNNSNTTEVVTFTATVTDNVGLSSVTLPTATLSNVFGGMYTFTKTYSLDDYSIGSSTDTLTLTAVDTANNTSTSTIGIVITTVDDVAPVITSLVASPSTVNLTTNSQTQIVTFTATVTDNISLATVLLSSATFLSVSNSTYTWIKSYSYSDYNFGSVTDTLTLTAIDSNNNITTQNLDLNIVKGDDLPPSITDFTSSKTTINLYSNSQSTIVYFYVTATDNLSVSGVTISGATFVSQTGSVYTFQKTISYVNYAYGTTTNTITAVATDSTGNTSSSTLDITINKYDNQDPVISSVSTNLTSVILNTSNTTRTLQISVICSDNQSISSVSVSNGAIQSLVSGNTYLFNKIYNIQDYELGTQTETFAVTVTDPAGNIATDSISILIDKEDEVDPVISSFFSNASNILLTQNNNTNVVEFTVTATDNFLLSTISIPNTTFVSQSGNDFVFQKTYSFETMTEAQITDTFTVTATDSYNNTTTSSIALVIEKVVYNYNTRDLNYYIEATANLNNNVSVVNDNVGINGGIITHENTYHNINYNLPTGSAVMSMMNISAKQGSTTLNTYSLDVTITANSDGTLSASSQVSGTDTIGYIQDTQDQVNYAYWDVTNPPANLNPDHVDKLSATLTASQIEIGKQSAIASVVDTYNGVSTLDSWAIQLSPVAPSLNNFINQYRLAHNRPTGQVFQNGEQVVLSTTQDYSVVIQGVDTSHTVVPPTTIQAVITHQDDAPNIQIT